MGKLGTQQIARQRAFTKGKLTQQVGAEKTQVAIRTEAQRIEEERIKKLNAEAQAKYELEKAAYEKEVAEQQATYERRVWLVAQINAQLEAQDYAGGSPPGLSPEEQKIWQEAMDEGASRGAYAEKYNLYPTGKVFKGEDDKFYALQSEDIAASSVKLEPEQALVKGIIDWGKTAEEYGFSQEEVKRYEGFGYSTKEARALAKASKEAGGMTFSPEYAKFIVQPTWTFKDEPIKFSINKIGEGYFKAEEFAKEKITSPAFESVEKWTGIDLTKSESQRRIKGYLPGVGIFPVNLPSTLTTGRTQKFFSGISADVFKDIKEKPIKQVAMVGVGGGLGFAFKGTSTGLGAIPKAGAYVSPLFKTTATLGGGYLLGSYVYSTGKSIFSASTPEEAGGILGVAGKDIFLFGEGFKAGETGFLKAQGLWSTSGKIKIPTEKITPEYVIKQEYSFPRTKGGTGQELRTFQDSPYNLPIKKYKGYGETFELVYPKQYKQLPFKVPSTAYHVTPGVFYNKVLTSSAGTSELPGLYTSFAPSFYFSKVGGTGSSYSWKGFLQSILSPDGRPGVAGLQPEGLRISPYAPSKPYQIGGTGKWFKWSFKKTAKPGWLDLPGMKTGAEAESIARIDAGSYGLISKEYYTIWKGIRLPIDVFKYDAGLSTQPSRAGASLFGGISSGSYSTPTTSYFPLFVSSFDYKPSETYISPIKDIISSSISKPPSKVSYISRISKPSKISRVSSKISPPSSKISGSSYFKSSSKSSSYKQPPYNPPYSPPKKTTIIPPFIRRPKAPKQIRTRLKSPRGRVRREPSLWALGEQIKAPRRRYETSGLVIRPIIIKPFRKRKKRKRR